MVQEAVVPAGVFISMSIIVALFSNMIPIAEQASETTLAATQSMQNALPCAYAGLPLEECSPHLFANDAQELLKTTQAQLDSTKQIEFSKR